MTYTHEENETCYYLNELWPYLKTIESFDQDLLRLEYFLFHGQFKRLSEKNKIKKMKEIVAEQSEIYLQNPPSYRQGNVAYLARLFNLSKSEETIIRFLVDVDNNQTLKRSLSRFEHDLEEKEKTLGAVAGASYGETASLLHADAPLLRLGLLERQYGGCYGLKNWAKKFFAILYKDDAHRYRALLGTPLKADEVFTRKDFAYVEGTDFALKLIKKAKQTKGFNILLYGVPGTGKTSFAKFLARSAKLDLFPVGIANEAEDAKNYRLHAYFRKQLLLKNVPNACLLFDEGEDMFSSAATCTSKIEINNFLENNKVPVIWTTNKIYHMDPAFIRRFTLAICFKRPPVEVRGKIWDKYLTRHRITCSKQDITALAKKYEVPPSMIESAARATCMVKGNLDTVKAHLSLMRQALNGGYKEPEEVQRTENFNPSLIHADMDLSALTNQVKSLGRLNFSLCLYGASGTGKSAYARHLAQMLGLEVIQRRASDIISMFVGGTEKNIAQAFSEAKEAKAMLVFDEADTFLRDRSLARNSWEVSGVNEMLTWMESHPYPFVCTTNLMDTLDPASLRRFSFKVKYDFLTREQVCEAFRHFFGVSVQASEVGALNRLTPGDFALVKNKAELLGKITHTDALKEMLAAEQKLKSVSRGGGIGFRL